MAYVFRRPPPIVRPTRAIGTLTAVAAAGATTTPEQVLFF